MRIGIAGYMGAGKTTCARSFESEGVFIIDADAEAKAVMSRDRKLQGELRRVFGDAVIDDGGDAGRGDNGVGSLHFDVLGNIVFESIDTLLAFNKIVHPPVVKHLEHLIADCDRAICILDAALIPVWNDAASWFDFCVWVDVDFDTRFNRLKAKRADVDERELLRRMKLQEEMMPAPKGGNWVILPDSECSEYIRNEIVTNKPPLPVPESAKSIDKNIIAALKKLVDMDLSTPLDKSFRDGFKNALTLFGDYQKEVISANNKTPACRAGCGTCCFHWAEDVNSFELAIIADHIKKNMPDAVDKIIKTCREDEMMMSDLEAIADDMIAADGLDGEFDRSFITLSSFYQLERPCPLLTSKGSCGIYEIRPITCRLYMNFGDAVRCRPENINDGDVVTYILDFSEEANELIEKLHLRYRRDDGSGATGTAFRTGIANELSR